VVTVGTASEVKFAEQLCERINGLQNVNHQGFLPIV
jgi:hypothetical protein